MTRRSFAPMRANQRDRLFSLAFMACSFRKSDGHDKQNKNRGKALAHGLALQADKKGRGRSAHPRPGITLKAFYQTPGALRQSEPQTTAADIFSLMRLTSLKR